MLVCILDGWGVNVEDEFNAVFSADTPCTDALKAVPKRYRSVKAHGTAVGLPSDADMGNSEVGHNALGSGQVRGVEGCSRQQQQQQRQVCQHRISGLLRIKCISIPRLLCTQSPGCMRAPCWPAGALTPSSPPVHTAPTLPGDRPGCPPGGHGAGQRQDV